MTRMFKGMATVHGILIAKGWVWASPCALGERGNMRESRRVVPVTQAFLRVSRWGRRVLPAGLRHAYVTLVRGLSRMSVRRCTPASGISAARWWVQATTQVCEREIVREIRPGSLASTFGYLVHQAPEPGLPAVPGAQAADKGLVRLKCSEVLDASHK
jgi:hypothetical protein